MDDNEKYRCQESDGEDREFLKKRYAGKTVVELNVEFEKLKKEFLDAHKELQQKSNFTKNRLTSGDKNGIISFVLIYNTEK